MSMLEEHFFLCQSVMMSDAKFSSAENLQQMLNSFAGFLYYYAIKIAREVTLIILKNEKRILHFLPFM